jgi:hypothetical protein
MERIGQVPVVEARERIVESLAERVELKSQLPVITPPHTGQRLLKRLSWLVLTPAEFLATAQK